MSEMVKLCTFWIGSELCGLPVSTIQEVIRPPRLTRVPLAPENVAGVVNLRGHILPVVSLRRRLGLDHTAKSEHVLVVKVAEATIGVLVDVVGDVMDLSSEDFEAAPGRDGAGTSEVVSGAYKLPDRLLLLLSVDRILRD
jgi:purine-binding chemotaxis protein CheW